MKFKDNVFEGYLDSEEKFYDYGTSDVSGDKIFDERTTGVSFYNQFLRSSDIEYLRDKKNLTGEIVYMSPNEYYSECGKHAWNHEVSVDSLKSQRARDKKTIDHLKQVITVYKKRFPMPFINYAEMGQEGLHRMYVAGELLGWDSPKHPVLCIHWADEDRHRREEKEKLDAEIEYSIQKAINAALQYKFVDMEDFKDQLQYELDRSFKYFDNITKPVKFKSGILHNDTVYVSVEDVTCEFDFDEINFKQDQDDDLDDFDLDNFDLDDDLDSDEFLKKYIS